MLSLYKASQIGYVKYNPACEAFIYLLKIQCDGLIAHFNVCLSQLSLSDNTRCAAHEILCVAVHWEGNYFSNVVFISQQHDHSVDTRGPYRRVVGHQTGKRCRAHRISSSGLLRCSLRFQRL